MVDLVKFSVAMFYSRNKNLKYKEGVVRMSTSLLGFLYREGIIKSNPFDESGQLKMDFEVRESDMNHEGKELFRVAIPKWWKKLDAGLDSSDITYLESEISKIRNSKAK